MFGPANRMTTMLVAKDRQAPAAEVPTDLERIALHKSLIAFAGRYSIEPGRIVIHVEISWNEAWSGTEQIRFYALHGDRMTLRTEPHRSATDGQESVYIQEWEKIAQRQPSDLAQIGSATAAAPSAAGSRRSAGTRRPAVR